MRLQSNRASVLIPLLLAGMLSGACGGGGGGNGGGNGGGGGADSGLDARPANNAGIGGCVAPEAPSGGQTVAYADAFPALFGLGTVTRILQAPGDASRWYLLIQTGEILVFDVADPGGIRTWLDFSGVVDTFFEGGMLGMAFDPDFPDTPEVYVSYTVSGSPLVSRIARVVLDDVDEPLNWTEEILLTLDQPAGNHNGGDIAFGPDNNLYAGFGDGGGAAYVRSQDTTNLFGTMIRIDVRGLNYTGIGSYVIPDSNPFAGNSRCSDGDGSADCPEIFAWGFRNPWRWSFDGSKLWVGDVGGGDREEIDLVEIGGNYGWACLEGTFDPGLQACPGLVSVEPVFEYPHSNGNGSITGGFVYRGSDIPALVGRYIYADFNSGRVWALEDDGNGGYDTEFLFDTPFNITTMGRSEDGEIYFSELFADGIYRLILDSGVIIDTVPTTLVPDVGCMDEDFLIPYSINAPFWSDGAIKTRSMGLPDGQTVSIDNDDDWVLPEGTVLVKSFELGGQLIETRLLMNHINGGGWQGYTYEWNDAETLATRVEGGSVRDVNGQQWIYPSEGECDQCHTQVAGNSLGLETGQLNGDFTYPSTGRLANQLVTLDDIAVFDTPLPGSPDTLPELPDPFDAGTGTLAERARAYLHTNCAQCHQPGGPTPANIDLRYTATLAETMTCNVPPSEGNVGILPADARLIAPGAPQNSVLLNRMDRRDANAMPPLASNEKDDGGVALVEAWIGSLGGC